MKQGARGRAAELAVSGRFLDALQSGPRGLVLAGEAGIGKTTLWKQVLAEAVARSYWVLSCRPTQSETALSFAALADLLAEVPVDVLAGLPAPQQRGLQVALLRAEPEEDVRDHRAISAGLLSVLTELATRAPVVVGIDDLRWLDRPSARVLEFAVRRFAALRVGLVATMRTPDEEVLPLGLAEALPPEQLDRVEVGPLAPDVLHRIVREQIGVAVPRPTLVRIQQASGGNPLFALEIARSVRRAGTRVSGSHMPVPHQVGDIVAERIEALSPAAHEQLLVASALANPTIELVAAAGQPGTAEGLPEAEEAGVVELEEGRIRFAHPLFASAVYSSATPEQRRRLHARIAGVVTDIEEKARHLALSHLEPDEAVAVVMDAGAERADARGAPSAAAELAEHARALTPSSRPDDLARRTIAGASYHVASGDRKRARAMLEDLITTLPVGTRRADALRIVGEIRYQDDSLPEAARLWRQALGEAGDDARLRATLETCLAYADLMMADFRSAKPHAWAALELAQKLGDPGTLAEALAVVSLVELGKGTSAGKIHLAISLENPDHRLPVGMRPSLIIATVLCWEERLEEAAERFAWVHRQIRDRGEDSELPYLALPMAWNLVWRGQLAAAARLADESLETSLELGDKALIATSQATMGLVHAYQGKVEEAREEAEEAAAGFRRAGWTVFTVLAIQPLGVLGLSLGDFEGVHRTLRPLVDVASQICAREPLGASFLADEIEALVGLDDLERAHALIDQLEANGRRRDRAWALGAAARCRGLAIAASGDLEGASAALEEAVRQHSRLPMPFELARTLVAQGQIQRRRKERLAAKHSLGQAIDIFQSRGAVLWAERARRELGRLGLHPGDANSLTKTERRVAEMVVSGLTNREVAAQLFISPKTVEANLSKIYSKYGVRSRTELAARMAERVELPGRV
jgi:DNA-binding CsgD family transcriptional regulator